MASFDVDFFHGGVVTGVAAVAGRTSLRSSPTRSGPWLLTVRGVLANGSPGPTSTYHVSVRS